MPKKLVLRTLQLPNVAKESAYAFHRWEDTSQQAANLTWEFDLAILKNSSEENRKYLLAKGL